MAKKTESLAAQEGALTAPAFSLPDIFTAPQDAVKARFISPYVTFAHPKRADEWQKISAKCGVPNEGDMHLVTQDWIVKLDTMKCTLLCCKQYWAEANPAGEVLRVSFAEKPKPFKEHIEAVLLVYYGDTMLPANICFRTTKCPAGKALADALALASTPEWGEQGPAHKESLVCSQPFMRFYGEVSLGPQRGSKTSGLPYRPTVCNVKPTSVPEWRILKAFCESPESQKSMDDAAERFKFRMDEARKKPQAA